jgi:hypothetical protein
MKKFQELLAPLLFLGLVLATLPRGNFAQEVCCLLADILLNMPISCNCL